MEIRQFVRHTSTLAAVYEGRAGELTVDLASKSLRVHDGVTLGGFELARKDLSNVLDASSANAGRMTAAQAVIVAAAWTSANHGSGSGLDADLIDGLTSDQFVRSDVDDTVAGRLTMNGGFVATASSVSGGLSVAGGITISSNGLSNTGGIATDTVTVSGAAVVNGLASLQAGLTVKGANADFQSGLTANFATLSSATIAGGTPWTNANDGAGSGLNADSLDGITSSQFARLDVATPFTVDIVGANANVISRSTVPNANAHFVLQDSSATARGIMYYEGGSDSLVLGLYTGGSASVVDYLLIRANALIFNGLPVARELTTPRFNSINIGADTDILLYEDTNSSAVLRVGPSGSHKYFKFAANGNFQAFHGEISASAGVVANNGNLVSRSNGNVHMWLQTAVGATKSIVYYDTNGDNLTLGLFANGSGGISDYLRVQSGSANFNGKNLRHDGNIFHGRVTTQYNAILSYRLPAGWTPSFSTITDTLTITHNLGTDNYSIVPQSTTRGSSTLTINYSALTGSWTRTYEFILMLD